MKRIGNAEGRIKFVGNKATSFPGIRDRQHIENLFYRVVENEDNAAFHELFRELYKPLCLFCERIVQVREVAEELVSDVFCTIWKNKHRISVNSPRSYLYTAVRNRAYDYLRAFDPDVCCELELAANLPSENHTLHDALEHQELESQLNRCIGMLPRQCKIIFELSREEGLKHREIAAELCISVKTVEAQIGKALKQLRKIKEVSS